jgi:hypothetical protein
MRTCTRLAVGLIALPAFATAAAEADAVVDWNAIAFQTLTSQTPALPPFPQARFAAIAQLAVFEAVNAIERDYHPYLGTIRAPRGASAEAAAVAAAHAVLVNYFPGNATTLDAARAASLAKIRDGWAKDAGVAAGQAAAAAMIALRSNDGSSPPQFHAPASTDPGVWQKTPSCPAAGGVFPHWGNVTPFGIDRGDQFRSAPPPGLGDPRYTRDFDEVKRVGGQFSTQRPQDRADVAQFYNAVAAPALWNIVARQIAVARGTSLAKNAQAFALVNMALNDALVSVMETKYHYDFWRPETAIRAADTDGNAGTQADPSYAPFIVTPCFPSYPSGHASASYAARAALEAVYGRGPYFITLTTPALPGITLQYDRLREITSDVDDARVFGGIHFRFDQVGGAIQGTRLGWFVVLHNLHRVHGRWFGRGCHDWFGDGDRDCADGDR